MNKKIPLNRQNQAYWDKRINDVEAYIKQNIADDEAYSKVLQEYYDNALKSIDEDINAELMRLGNGNLPLAQQKVKQMDIQEMAKRAKKIVENKDWSAEANIRMKIYNATMQINRLELLKSQIGYDMLDAGMQVEAGVKKKLTDAYQDELKRQAGILADTVPAKSLINLKHTLKVVMTGIEGVDFSHRLWTDQDILKAELDQILIKNSLSGDSPQQLARRLHSLVSDTVGKHRYITERIVRTETARVQTQATLDSLNQYGYKYCKWHDEPGACKLCRNIADFDSLGINELGVYKVDDVPPLPEHPNCRCAISAYWVDNPKDSKGMSRKRRDNQRKPINKEKQRKLTSDFRKNGGLIWQGDEADEYLKSKKASAINLGPDTIVLQKKPTISEVLEETYHAKQYQDGKITGSAIEQDRAEIEAQYYLIDMEKVYNIPKAEREQTRENLKYWLNKLKEDEGRES